MLKKIDQEEIVLPQKRKRVSFDMDATEVISGPESSQECSSCSEEESENIEI